MKVAVLDQDELFRELASLRHPEGVTDGHGMPGGSASGMLLSSIVRSVPDVIYQLDGDGRILFINDAIKQYGYNPEELTGTSIFDLVHPEDRDRARHRLNERRSGDRSTRLFEVRLLARNQEPVSFEFAPSTGQLEAPTLLVSAEGIYAQDQDQARRFLCTQGVARDITERRRTNEALERVNRELEARVTERTAELRQVNAELRQQLDLQRQLELRERVRARIREEIWRMRDLDDIGTVIAALHEGLESLGVPVAGCSINLLDVSGPALSVKSWSRTAAAAAWVERLEGEDASTPVFRIWSGGVPVYRRELATDDPYNEAIPLERAYGMAVHSVLDVPFSHGTVGVNSPRPDAFSPQDIQVVADLAGVLSEGFLRLEDLRALRASEERYRSFVERLPAGVVQIADGGRVLYHNPYALRMYGYSAEELATLNVRTLFIRPGDLEEMLAGLRETGEHFYLCPMRRRDGTVVWARGTTRVIRNAEGREVYQGIVEDVTAAHELEEQKARLEAQLEVSRRLEAVGQLTAGVAHHFNNMLQGVVGNLYLAELRAPEEIRPLLDSAKSAADRAAEMVRQLMLIARQGMHESPQRLDLVLVLQTTLDLARETFGPRLKLTAAMPSSPVVVVGVAGQLRQVFLQLLLNARDAVEATREREPVVTVRLDPNPVLPQAGAGLPPSRYVRVEVEDNGVGMDEDTCRRAFDPFFTTKPVGYATGLGLPAVHAIVQQHRGRLECRSTPGIGTCLTVFLPLPGEE